MLTRLIDLCLGHRVVVLLAALVLALVGVASFRQLPFDAFPETTPPQITVNTVAPALSPGEVERQISMPLEQAISGLPGLTRVRSLSKFGLSQIVAVFDDDTDPVVARQLVGERVGGVDLPSRVGRPTLGPASSSLGEVFQYLVQSERLTAAELRTLHHWVIRPQLVRVPGVAEINTWGGEQRQIHVVVDPERLVKHAVTLDDVATAVREGNRNVSGGVLDSAGQSQFVLGRGLARDVSEFAELVVAHHEGTPILLGDVADVRQDHEIRRGAVTAEGRGEMVLGLGFALLGENSGEVTRRLAARLDEVRASLPDGVTLTPVYQRTDLVDQVLDTVRTNLLEGALLVVAVLFVFLGNLRAGLIVAVAIPLSMLFAFNAMLRFGIAGSLMSLGALDFGLIVDSSLIMVENAERRLAEDDTERPVREVIREAALEVRKPTLFGELIIAIVYVPVLALEGVEGKLFGPMAATVIFALAGSMLLSVTLMPVLASYLLRRGVKRGPNALVRGLTWIYRPVLEWALDHRLVVVGAALGVLVYAASAALSLGSEFVPRLREQAVVINTVRMAGISLDESVRYGTLVERRLLEHFPDEIAHVWTRTGSAEVATDPMGVEVSDVFLTLTPRETWTRASTQDELVVAMDEALSGLPGMRSVFSQPIEMRVNEMLAGIRSDVGVQIYGDDLDVLSAAAERLREQISALPGAVDVTVEQLTGQTTLDIAVDRLAAGRYGVSVAEVLATVESMGRTEAGEFVDGQRRVPVVLRVDPAGERSPERLGAITIRAASGALVPLSAVTTITLVDGPSSINREWARRRVTVQANVRGRDVGSFVADVREVLEDRSGLPTGYYTHVGGQFENYERARQRLLLVVPVALLLVFSLLYLTYGRALDALRIFVGVPFAAVGGIAALHVRGMPFSIAAGVGFVALCGVAVLGDMVLVSRVRQLVATGIERVAAVREAAVSRLRPVLMTSLVAALGFVPMATNTGVGAEVQRPLATVVIGGMISATLATLVLLPVLLVAFGQRSKQRNDQ